MTNDVVKLLTTREGSRLDFVELSVVGAAQHALSVLSMEEGCLQGIEVQGQLVWSFEEGRDGWRALEELAAGDLVA